MGAERLGLKFGVELDGDEPDMVGQLDELNATLVDAPSSWLSAARRRLVPWLAAAAALFAILAWALLGRTYAEPRASGSFLVSGGGKVQRGSVILTEEGSATLVLGGYCRIELEPHTALRIEGAKRAERVFLDRGGVACDVDGEAGAFAVRTDLGMVSVRGTRFVVRLVEREGGEEMAARSLLVKVVAGLVLVSGAWGEQVLAAGEELGAPQGKGAPEKAKGKPGHEAGWMPPGLTDAERAEWQDGRPPGWSQGKKTGWKGAPIPPGLAKEHGKGKAKGKGHGETGEPKEKGAAKGAAFEEQLKQVVAHTRGIANARGHIRKLDMEDLDAAVEGPARYGVPLPHVRRFVEKALEKGLGADELGRATRAIAYGNDKGTDYEQLGAFVQEQLEGGLRGDPLALSIYKEITRRHEERTREHRKGAGPAAYEKGKDK